METTGNSFSRSETRIRDSVRRYGLQKQLASKLGMSDSNLSKLLDGQLPVFLRLLDELGLEVSDPMEVEYLRRVLKRYL